MSLGLFMTNPWVDETNKLQKAGTVSIGGEKIADAFWKAKMGAAFREIQYEKRSKKE